MSSKIQENITNRKEFSARFRNLRELLKLSQRELAKFLGFTANTQISKFENAESEPTLETLRKLAQLSRRTDIRIDLHELITGKPSHIVEDWKEENKKLLELLAKYISSETSRLIAERHHLWGMLSEAEQKAVQHIAGSEELIPHLKVQIKQVEGLLADVAEDQHYVQDALDGIRQH
jgi:transcriptional regulator with XRE-family HTH domain